jgi:hypothetical protein
MIREHTRTDLSTSVSLPVHDVVSAYLCMPQVRADQKQVHCILTITQPLYKANSRTICFDYYKANGNTTSPTTGILKSLQIYL